MQQQQQQQQRRQRQRQEGHRGCLIGGEEEVVIRPVGASFTVMLALIIYLFVVPVW